MRTLRDAQHILVLLFYYHEQFGLGRRPITTPVTVCEVQLFQFWQGGNVIQVGERHTFPQHEPAQIGRSGSDPVEHRYAAATQVEGVQAANTRGYADLGAQCNRADRDHLQQKRCLGQTNCVLSCCEGVGSIVLSQWAMLCYIPLHWGQG